MDTDMSYDEFLEAVLRLGCKLAGANSPMTVADKFRQAAELLAGELEGAHIKLSWPRMEEVPPRAPRAQLVGRYTRLELGDRNEYAGRSQGDG